MLRYSAIPHARQEASAELFDLEVDGEAVFLHRLAFSFHHVSRESGGPISTEISGETSLIPRTLRIFAATLPQQIQ